jgi:hypothetical protein
MNASRANVIVHRPDVIVHRPDVILSSSKDAPQPSCSN